MIHYLIFNLRTHISGKNIFNDIYVKYQICIIISKKSSNICDGQELHFFCLPSDTNG